jgi:hypothetical protein
MYIRALKKNIGGRKPGFRQNFYSGSGLDSWMQSSWKITN